MLSCLLRWISSCRHQSNASSVALLIHRNRKEKSSTNVIMNKLPFFTVLVMYTSSVAHWIIGIVPWARTGDFDQLYTGPIEVGLSVTLSITVWIKSRVTGSS
jgi:hypothetical protein